VAPAISQGEVWDVNFDPAKGREQAGVRPALVISIDGMNHGPSGLAIVLALTKIERAEMPTRVPVQPPEGGLAVPSWIICEQPRTVSTDRFERRRGQLHRATLEKAVNYVRLLIST
jgi:mRNA interferase MazF